MEPIEYRGTAEEHFIRMAEEKRVPVNGILELTPLCNMDCEMCFVRLSPEELKKRGRLRTAGEWVALGKEMSEAGTLFVLLTGGEPLTYPGFQEVYTALKKMGMVITVNTNGTLIDETWADFFLKYRPRRINITLYGKDTETYTKLCHYPDGFGKTLNAIRLLKERGIDVKVNGSITPRNIGDLEGLCSLTDSLGVCRKFDTYMYPASRERSRRFCEDSRLSPEDAACTSVRLAKREAGELFPAYAEEKLRRGNAEPGPRIPVEAKCRAGRCSFVVNWQGMMRPCIMLGSPEVPVFEKGFRKSWEEISRIFSCVRLSPECGACSRRQVCPVCPAAAYLETGSYDGVPEYLCRYTEEQMRLFKEEAGKEGQENG